MVLSNTLSKRYGILRCTPSCGKAFRLLRRCCGDAECAWDHAVRRGVRVVRVVRVIRVVEVMARVFPALATEGAGLCVWRNSVSLG